MRVSGGADPEDGIDVSAHDDKSFSRKDSIDPSANDDTRVKLSIVGNLQVYKSVQKCTKVYKSVQKS